MEKKLVDLFINAIGVSILTWLLYTAIKDILLKSEARRKKSHNLIIVVLSLIYMVKIIVKDIYPSF